MTKADETRESDVPFGAAAVTTIEKLTSQLMANLPGTLGGEDIEALHDMRVASRRLRAALGMFAAAFPRKPLLSIQSRVKSITGALGSVRDADVFIEFLSKYSADSHSEIGWLIDHELANRETSRLAMIEALRRITGSDFAPEVSGLLMSAALTSYEVLHPNTISFCSQAYSMTLPRVGELLDLSTAVGDPEDSAGLHAMRIAAKRLRYTLEPFASYWGRPLSEKISAVKTAQEYLGLIHDYDVWMERLTKYTSEGKFPSHTRELSDIVVDLRASREAEYTHLFDLWQELTANRFFDSLLMVLENVPNINPTISGGSDGGRKRNYRGNQSQGDS